MVAEGRSGVRLPGSRCTVCGRYAYPHRSICLECGGQHDDAELSGEGMLHAWTAVATPPAGFSDPYQYGSIDLVEGPRLLALVDGTCHIGAAVHAVQGTVRDGASGFRFEVTRA